MKAEKTKSLTVFVISFQASTKFETTEVVITKEMEEEEKQLMEEGERKEQEMLTKVWQSLINVIAPLACSSGVLFLLPVTYKLLAMIIHSCLLFFFFFLINYHVIISKTFFWRTLFSDCLGPCTSLFSFFSAGVLIFFLSIFFFLFNKKLCQTSI